jgi:uncharacterized membrane protein
MSENRTYNPSESPRTAAGSLSAHIDQNIEGVVALQRREWESASI